MSSFDIITKKTLSEYTLRDESEYDDAVAAQVIREAILLFKIGTCLTELPTSPLQREIAMTAIHAMADAFEAEKRNAEQLQSPFQSESIGSYNYSKISGLIYSGVPTGIGWFDIAIQQLSVCGRNGTSGDLAGGGVIMFEDQGTFVSRPPNVKFVGPADNIYGVGYRD